MKKILNQEKKIEKINHNLLYSSMNFAYRLDKNIEVSPLNYLFVSDSITDILSENISFKFSKSSDEISGKEKYIVSNDGNCVAYYNDKKTSLANVEVVKKGDSLSVYKSGVLGYNSAILSVENITLLKSYVKTYSSGSKGFLLKEKGKIGNIFEVIFETMSSNANAIESSNESILRLKKVYAYTNGENSGGVCVSAQSKVFSNSITVYTASFNSPSFYINGSLFIEDSLMETRRSYLGVMEGDSSFFSINSSLRGELGLKIMNKKDDNFINKVGIVKRYISINEGFAFDVENSSSVINLLDMTVFSLCKKILKTSSQFDNKNVDVHLKKTFMNGEIVTDDKTTINIFFNKGNTVFSKISGNVNLFFKDKTHYSLTLTGDSFVRKIDFFNNDIKTFIECLNLNGYTLYYDSVQNEWMKDKSYYFEDGSRLLPNRRFE